eukprot:g4462.t1
MAFTKLFAFVVSLSGILQFVQSNELPLETWKPNQASRNLLQSSIPESCNYESGVQWYGSRPPRGNYNLASPGACCELCQETSSCRAWVWSRRGRICYLLDTVEEPRRCFLCSGGILDEEEPINDQDVIEFLQQCADDGRTAALAAAIAACGVLTSSCLPALPELAVVRIAEDRPSEKSLQDVLEGSCETVFNQTCMNESFRRASEVNPDCGAILDRGPGGPSRNCEGPNEARRLFNNEVERLCNS